MIRTATELDLQVSLTNPVSKLRGLLRIIVRHRQVDWAYLKHENNLTALELSPEGVVYMAILVAWCEDYWSQYLVHGSDSQTWPREWKEAQLDYWCPRMESHYPQLTQPEKAIAREWTTLYNKAVGRVEM